MATISKTIAPSSTSDHLRQFEARRDLRAVADLVELCFADTLDADGKQYVQQMRSAASNPALMRWASAAAEWANVPLNGYVWYEGERLVGNASLIPHYVKGRRFYLIANVAVHPDYRRQGIARILTLRCIDHARQRASASVWLHVREENSGAVNLYRSLGFLERARRTAWASRGEPAPAQALQGVRFGSPNSRHWNLLRGWLMRDYPPELTWHLPIRLNALRPGLVGAFYRVFYNAYIQQWALLRGGELLGVVSWQSIPARSNVLWLAVPPEQDERLVHSLLVHVRRKLVNHRTLMLDYPARLHSQVIQAAGFHAEQTLIWMELGFQH